MAGPRLLVLQHIECEPPGAFADELAAWGGQLVTVMVNQGQELPDVGEFDGIIAMGGPMGAYELERLPWLAGELAFIADAVRAELPFWGVCLGSQLLAASLGAAVAPGVEPEVGVLPVQRTPEAAADPVFALAPDSFRALQWHGDTFELPEGAVRLARSEAYENQAFVVNRAYGLQFHIEIGRALGLEWVRVPAYAHSLESTLGPGALPLLLEQIAAHEREMTALARRLFGGWLEHVVGASRPARSEPGVSAPAEAQPAPG
jgi:GMP synthase-like glutamine amidotransferase